MVVGILKEHKGETRVSMLPETVAQLIKKSVELIVEKGAGEQSFFSDADYEAAGAKLTTADQLVAEANVILSIHPPQLAIGADKVLIGVYQPLFQHQLMNDWAAKNMTVFSLDMLPRTTRAQSMDVLSSQANIAGYKAIIHAADIYPKYFPMFMTAAGSITPAKVLILGAGVAGLQAIATARRLGAVVEVFDTRPAVKEEVMSLGAKFVEVEGAADASAAGGYAVEQSEDYQRKQKEKIAESLAKADIVVTTAQIPGKKAPILITEEMLSGMKKGSVIIDLAAATGGNTPFTKDKETVWHNGVRIEGSSDLPSSMPADASKLYGKNVFNFLQLITTKEGSLALNWEDDLVQGACITHEGQVVHERVKSLVNS